MARIRHIAIQTQDEEATKNFYVENFGLEVVRKLESARTSGYFLTDGHINLAILRLQHIPAMRPEQSGQHRAECFIVIDQENRLHAPGRAEFFRLSSKFKNLRGLNYGPNWGMNGVEKFY